MIWTLIFIIAAVCLLFPWRDRSAIWTGCLLGAACGAMAAVATHFLGHRVHWWLIAECAACVTLLGAAVEVACQYLSRRYPS